MKLLKKKYSYRDYKKRYYRKNQEKIIAKSRDYYQNNKEKRKDWQNKYNLKTKEKRKEYRLKNKEHIYKRYKEYYLKNQYNLTIEEYEKLFSNQNGVCKICGSKNKNKTLFVDHNHKTGKVRGLLCAKCNFGLGVFEDNIELLNKAIEYLKHGN